MSDDRPAHAGIVRFGVFEVDLRSEELRRRGVRVPLQRQPFRMLARLLERPGELVTREALRQELWPADTFVDFELGLNAVVRRLRDALGDSAETPRFIETLPKRGYRFLAPVHSDGAPPAPGANHRRRVIAWLLAGAFLAVGAAVIGWRALRPPPLSETDLIVLGDVDNQTTEAVLTGTMKHALAVKLAESHFINVLSEERARDVLRSMRRKPDEILTPTVAREVCQRSRAKATVTGAIASLGSAYVISLNAEACSTGESLVRDQVQAAGKELILTALDEMAARLRRRLGESLRAVNAANTPLESGTTSSLDALKAFTEGERRFSTGAQAAAMPFYRRAIELDPDFAMAHAKLGVACFNLSMPCGVAELARAFELRDRLSEREQFYVTAQYYRLAEGDLEASRPVYEVWKAAYPRDPVPYTSLGLLFTRQGQLDRAVTEFEGAVGTAPTGHTYSNLFEAYLLTSRVADAQRVLEAWERADGVPLHYARFLIAFLQRNVGTLEAEGAAVGNGLDGLDLQADRARAVAFFGRLKRARTLFSLAEAGREGADFTQASILLKLDQAVWEAEVGNQRRARGRVSEVWPLRGGTVAQETAILAGSLAAIALAACGNAADATAVLDSVNPPGSPEPQRPTLRILIPAARARIDLARGRFAEVLERLRPTARGDLAGPLGYYLAGQANGLVGAYLRGQAQLGLHRNRQAVNEFQKILDHPGIARFAAYQALAPIYLARAYAAAGEVQQSRAAYEQFLSLWQDGDPDIPVLDAARREYERLRQSRSTGTGDGSRSE